MAEFFDDNWDKMYPDDLAKARMKVDLQKVLFLRSS
jgi:hypothetical protein